MRDSYETLFLIPPNIHHHYSEGYAEGVIQQLLQYWYSPTTNVLTQHTQDVRRAQTAAISEMDLHMRLRLCNRLCRRQGAFVSQTLILSNGSENLHSWKVGSAHPCHRRLSLTDLIMFHPQPKCFVGILK